MVGPGPFRGARESEPRGRWPRGRFEGGGDDSGRESPRGGRGGRPRPHTKVSFGIILTRINPDTHRPEAVLGRGRYSYEFSEFVHGRYSRKNTRMIVALFEAMSLDERLDVYSLDFAQMWFRIWLTAPHRELYYKKLTKFQVSWMRDDSGEYLRRLVTGAAGETLSTPAPPRWIFPKGRRHSSCEMDINCAIREFGEEAGIAKKDYQILPGIRRRMSYVHMGIRYVNVFYVALARRDLAPSVDLRHLDQAAEVAEVRWLDIEQIRLVDAPPRRLEAAAAPVFRYVKKFVRGVVRPRALSFSLFPATGRGGALHDAAAHFAQLRRDAPGGGRPRVARLSGEEGEAPPPAETDPDARGGRKRRGRPRAARDRDPAPAEEVTRACASPR
jgi:8-oxo-dGTP pyrophosphatase MutT (NUDIX family)